MAVVEWALFVRGELPIGSVDGHFEGMSQGQGHGVVVSSSRLLPCLSLGCLKGQVESDAK